ncbi:MAG: hypothetical protein IRY94_17875 [Rhodospirillaceae bacterium]|nr:hypothetical protein [Rhodospirillaceae bacterium]
MGGFLPLIEAFAAFALTMLALATAVSSILAAGQRAARVRALGMLQMIEYYYRNEVQPFLTVQGLSNTEYEATYTMPASAAGPVTIGPEQLLGYGSEARRIVGIAATTGGTAELGADGGIVFTPAPAVPAAAAAPVPVTPSPQSVTCRVRTDFTSTANAVGKPFNTFLVDMVLLPVPRDGDALARERLLADSPAGAGPWAAVAAWWRRFRRAAHIVEYLTDEEFLTRLRVSEVGRTIADSRSSDDRDLCYAHLLERFHAVCRAASERFARGARLCTVALGFVTTFLINIDSIALLDRYLQDENLAASVLASQDRFVQAATPGQAGSADEETAAATTALLGRVGEAVDAAVDQMTEAFPVGWSLYPNCAGAAGSPRCHRIGPAICQDAAGLLQCVGRVAAADTGGFVRWLLGVILTAVLAGLGAPFWMEVVNNFLRARNLTNNYRKASRSD